MIDMKAFLNEDDTKVSLQFKEKVMTLTAEQLDGFIEVLFDIRSRMQPPMDQEPDAKLN